MTCEKCGRELAVSDWPFCPHERGIYTNVPDDVPGGFIVENGFDTPQRFYSHSEHRAALAAKGLEIRAKWAGPNDKHLSRWDAPSAYTLEGAKQMLERIAQERAERVRAKAEAESFPITVTDGEVFTYARES